MILMALHVSHNDKCRIYLCYIVVQCLLGIKNCQYIHYIYIYIYILHSFEIDVLSVLRYVYKLIKTNMLICD